MTGFCTKTMLDEVAHYGCENEFYATLEEMAEFGFEPICYATEAEAREALEASCARCNVTSKFYTIVSYEEITAVL